MIEELPVIVMLGKDFSLCLTSANKRDPFKSLASAELNHRTLNRLAEDLYRCMTSRDFMFASANGMVRPLEEAPVILESICLRSNWPLGWKKVRAVPVTLDPTLEVQSRLLNQIK